MLFGLGCLNFSFVLINYKKISKNKLLSLPLNCNYASSAFIMTNFLILCKNRLLGGPNFSGSSEGIKFLSLIFGKFLKPILLSNCLENLNLKSERPDLAKNLDFLQSNYLEFCREKLNTSEMGPTTVNHLILVQILDKFKILEGHKGYNFNLLARASPSLDPKTDPTNSHETIDTIPKIVSIEFLNLLLTFTLIYETIFKREIFNLLENAHSPTHSYDQDKNYPHSQSNSNSTHVDSLNVTNSSQGFHSGHNLGPSSGNVEITNHNSNPIRVNEVENKMNRSSNRESPFDQSLIKGGGFRT